VLEGALTVQGAGREWTAVCNGTLPRLSAAAAKLGAQVVAEQAATLEEIFLARVGSGAACGESVEA
jgi:ABC-2 type transport system ATP-binding protein